MFLLSMRSGAVGINLTAATHVFLLEPALNPALTEQAIGRSWRMGQRKEVFVKHLVAKDSVESNIAKLLAKRAEGKSSAADSEDPEDAEKVAAEKAAMDKMTKGELAGHLRADKQKLRAEELKLLFAS